MPPIDGGKKCIWLIPRHAIFTGGHQEILGWALPSLPPTYDGCGDALHRELLRRRRTKRQGCGHRGAKDGGLAIDRRKGVTEGPVHVTDVTRTLYVPQDLVENTAHLRKGLWR